MQLSAICETRRAVSIHNRFQALEAEEELVIATQAAETHAAFQEEVYNDVEDRSTNVKSAKAEKVRRGGALRLLREVVPAGMNSLEDHEWEELEMAVDSGASETVLGEDMLRNIDTTEGAACKRGVQYEVANGELVPNLGEKKFTCVDDGGNVRGITAQVCEVNKPLLSVRRLVQAGNRVVFDNSGGYIEDQQGGRIHMKEQGGMYMMRVWVQRDFQGQAVEQRP